MEQLGAVLNEMVTAIVEAIAALVKSIADFVKTHAPIFATVLGFIMLGTFAIRFGKGAFTSVVSWLRGLF